MTLKQAVKALSNHQKWRKGSETIPQTDPKELSEALEIAINILKNIK